MEISFVLIDFENVQPQKMHVLKGGRFKIKVFLGANQSKLPLETVRALQDFGSDAEYIQIDGSGTNALDFHIAYYIGCLATQNPDANFHVISKDTGFDPLIRHLRTQKIRCQRSASLNDIPRTWVADARTVSEMTDAVAQNLAKRSGGKPSTERTLRSTIKSMFAGLSGSELDGVLDALKKRGFVEIVNGNISYHAAEESTQKIRLLPVPVHAPMKAN